MQMNPQFRQVAHNGNDLTDSINKISESNSVLAEKRKHPKLTSVPAVTIDFKYSFMWQNIERLFQKLSEDDVDDLNYQFITLTRNKIAASVAGAAGSS